MCLIHLALCMPSGITRKIFFSFILEKFHAIVKAKRLTSVREVYNEVSAYGNRLSDWADENKDNLFTDPTEDEQQTLQEIFSDQRNQKLVSKRKQAGGGVIFMHDKMKWLAIAVSLLDSR